jgi:helix-turn-helix protein
MTDCRKKPGRRAVNDGVARLLRLKPASQYISVSPNTLRGLVQKGLLPVIKFGSNAPWLIDRNDLDLLIERTKVTM